MSQTRRNEAIGQSPLWGLRLRISLGGLALWLLLLGTVVAIAYLAEQPERPQIGEHTQDYLVIQGIRRVEAAQDLAFEKSASYANSVSELEQITSIDFGGDIAGRRFSVSQVESGWAMVVYPGGMSSAHYLRSAGGQFYKNAKSSLAPSQPLPPDTEELQREAY